MNKDELVGFLTSQSGWSKEEELSQLPYWNALLGAARDFDQVDGLRNFTFLLGKFIEANASYTTPESTLTG